MLLVVAAGAAAAAPRSFGIESFAVAIDLRADGSVDVEETLSIMFHGSHNGIFRMIPVRETRSGLDSTLRIEAVHVLDEDRRPLRTEVQYPGHYVKIKAWVPGATDAIKTVRILYRVRRAILAFDDHDELYWNVTSNEWDVPIRTAWVTVTLPPTLAPSSVQSTAYTGPRGAAGRDWTEDRRNDTIGFTVTRPLRPREGLTIVLGWPAGIVARPSTLQKAWWGLTDNWPLALPVLTLVLMGLVWRAYGRDPASTRSIKPEYEPPARLSPAQGGTLIDERCEPRDVVATLVDAAVRGYVQIVRPEDDDRDFLFRRLKPLAGDPSLHPLERFILQKVFGEGLTLPERRLSELRRNYDYVFTPIRDVIDEAMVRERFFAASPFWVRQGWGALGVLVMLLGAGLLPYLGALESRHQWTLPVGVGLSGLVILAFARIMPRRTRRGVEALVRVRGFQEFLERAEKDRLERLPADTLHRWLPWAIALGVTERWIYNWQGFKVDPPVWLDGRAPFDLPSYSRDVQSFGRQSEEALLTSRRSGDGWSGGSGFRSSDSSGSSGGGSSGGGLGGGGGGIF